ncbi:alkylated DNA repair protein alkB-like protein 8 isoform X2 [Cucumis melo var. makuwa]|uniref:Alkylated DNA repair protein alkB-like protein 8 isoform X2 n=1 Tax=Cucumis melo var. makuwa TaxID=1194695 RepID=A0A5D3DZ35_CUCMM|nr:alkylated DNA repair protein alkB-like protein 8 isoform X2 [Cucumis melo var. makuwa]TYK28764.1 alkylated DNA repair protein alkB-like protein 8 isoform X2 [Cucumis melo var. makuwa]
MILVLVSSYVPLKNPGPESLLRRFIATLALSLEDFLRKVNARPWNNLAKHGAQHYGYEFCYQDLCVM